MGIKERWRKYKPLPDDILQRIEYLTPFFRERRVDLAYLFGSLSRGAGNDVDIALLHEEDSLIMREELQRRLGSWRLDIINLKNAPVRLAFEVISSGKLIYKINTETENLFEMNVLRQYHDLKPVRDRQMRYLKENLGVGI